MALAGTIVFYSSSYIKLDASDKSFVIHSAVESISARNKLWRISFCLNKAAGSFDAFIGSKYFSINILASNQQEIAKQFSQRSFDKFTNIDYQLGAESKTPLLTGGSSFIQCKKFKEVECGDHFIFIGEVVQIAVDESKLPLLYFAKSYREMK